MIITDSTDTTQMHFWVRCTRDQTLEDGRKALKGHRYFVTWPWASPDCGACTDPEHPNCDAGAIELAGLEAAEPVRELFCAADFEPVGKDEAAELMASMIRGPAEIDTTLILDAAE
jgi:hypothetical protein